MVAPLSLNFRVFIVQFFGIKFSSDFKFSTFSLQIYLYLSNLS